MRVVPSKAFLSDHYCITAKYLSQVQDPNATVPVKIFAQAKAKEPANDALPKFAELYLSHQRVGTMAKETHTGKVVKEWGEALKAASSKPELADMSPAVSSFMAVKDGEELVASAFPTPS